MALENIIAPILVSCFGGLLYSIVGSYKEVVKGSEEFDYKKFFTAIPKSLVGGVIALLIVIPVGHAFNVGELQGFGEVVLIGFTSSFVLSAFLKKKKAEADVPA